MVERGPVFEEQRHDVVVAHGDGPVERGVPVEFVRQMHVRLERQQKAGGIGPGQ